MQDLGDNKVKNIIQNILSSRGDEFSWVSNSPEYYDDYDDQEILEEPQSISSPSLTTLNNIRNLCDVIQSNIVNSNTTDESFLSMGLMEIENKLKDFNDTLNSLMNYNNNQAMNNQPQILTGDIVLS